MKKFRRVLAGVLGVLLLGAGLASCTDKAGVNEYVVVIEKGLFDAESIKEVLFPGETAPSGDHRLFYIPSGVRNYISGESGDIPAIQFTSSEGVPLLYTGSSAWIVRPDEDVIKDFFVFCSKYECAGESSTSGGDRFSPGEGWTGMLKENYAQAWENSVRAVGGTYTRLELTNGSGIYDEFGTKVSERFMAELKEITNGEFWCAPSTQRDGECLPIKLTTSNIVEQSTSLQNEREAQAAKASSLDAQLKNLDKEKELANGQQELRNIPGGEQQLNHQRQLELIEQCSKNQGRGCLVIVGGEGQVEVKPQVTPTPGE